MILEVDKEQWKQVMDQGAIEWAMDQRVRDGRRRNSKERLFMSKYDSI